MKATLTSKGQVTIPFRIRKKLGLKAGDVLDFDEDATRLVAHRVTDDKAWQNLGKAATQDPWPGLNSMEILDELRGPVELPPKHKNANRR